MSELLLGEDEDNFFGCDAMELVKLKKEVRRLQRLLDEKDALVETAIKKAEAQIRPSRDLVPGLDIDDEALDYVINLHEVICFLLLFERFNADTTSDPKFQIARFNMHKAVRQWFEPMIEAMDGSSTLGIDKLTKLVEQMQRDCFTFNPSTSQKLGQNADFTTSPIRNRATALREKKELPF